ncbi:methyltransferase type 11 [Xylogone sp. PMI_703]|nr:methyltransferase type 11 [Xylogone sp. PMI_703]
MIFNIGERLRSYIEPYQGLSYAFHYQWKAFCSGNEFNISFRDLAFAEWYKELGHHFSDYEATTAVPELVSTASGIVFELGPGTGNQLPRYTVDNIERIYGIEPNPAFINVLHSRIQETSLKDKYTMIIGGLENENLLKEYGIVTDSMDCIVSMQVLCSVKNGPKAVEHLWKLLKPGGTIIFWEHGDSHEWLTRKVQKFWNLVWPFAIGGCQLGRPIIDLLLKNGDWEVLELETEGEPWSLMPRVWGRLRKVAHGQGTRSVVA